MSVLKKSQCRKNVSQSLLSGESVSAAGEVVRVETVPVPQVKGQLDSSITRWSENSVDDKLYVFSLRVFTTRAEGRLISAYSGLRPVSIGQCLLQLLGFQDTALTSACFRHKY